MSCQQTPTVAESYVLCERASGAVRFRVEADSDGGVPIDKIAGLLAVHCLVRGQAPEDYELLITARASLLHPVVERAQQFLAAGRALGAGIKVSRREQDVLGGILLNLSNKEIAGKLNLAERTVKFHVSSLLAKFGVTGRMALSREVALGRMPTVSASGQYSPQTLFGIPVRASEDEARDAAGPASAQTSTDAPRPRSRMFPVFERERYAT